ncbi:uncharacterized protein LOC136088498 [Hydra vulgaris]|uniref:Uncharacterized protein LOC136088498 n=1 Tax=Hydra vulgaris TaxID=6087 RepID=A0ABM4D2A8_HYDVU
MFFSLLNAHISDPGKVAFFEKLNLVYLPFSKILNVGIGGNIKFRDTTKWNDVTLDQIQKKEEPIFSISTSYATATPLLELNSTFDSKVTQELINLTENALDHWVKRVSIGYGEASQDITEVLAMEEENVNELLYEEFHELYYTYDDVKLNSRTGWLLIYMVARMFFVDHKLPFYAYRDSVRFYENLKTRIADQTFLQHVVDNIENIFSETQNVMMQARIETVLILSVLYSNKVELLNIMIENYIRLFNGEMQVRLFAVYFEKFSKEPRFCHDH